MDKDKIKSILLKDQAKMVPAPASPHIISTIFTRHITTLINNYIPIEFYSLLFCCLCLVLNPWWRCLQLAFQSIIQNEWSLRRLKQPQGGRGQEGQVLQDDCQKWWGNKYSTLFDPISTLSMIYSFIWLWFLFSSIYIRLCLYLPLGVNLLSIPISSSG